MSKSVPYEIKQVSDYLVNGYHGLETTAACRGRDLVPPWRTSAFFSSAFLFKSMPHNLACAARSLITSSTQSVSAAFRAPTSCNLCSSSGERRAVEVRSPDRQRRSCWMASGSRMLRQYCHRSTIRFCITRKVPTSSFSIPDRTSNSSHTIGRLVREGSCWSSSGMGVSGLG